MPYLRRKALDEDGNGPPKRRRRKSRRVNPVRFVAASLSDSSDEKEEDSDGESIEDYKPSKPYWKRSRQFEPESPGSSSSSTQDDAASHPIETPFTHATRQELQTLSLEHNNADYRQTLKSRQTPIRLSPERATAHDPQHAQNPNEPAREDAPNPQTPAEVIDLTGSVEPDSHDTTPSDEIEVYYPGAPTTPSRPPISPITPAPAPAQPAPYIGPPAPAIEEALLLLQGPEEGVTVPPGYGRNPDLRTPITMTLAFRDARETDNPLHLPNTQTLLPGDATVDSALWHIREDIGNAILATYTLALHEADALFMDLGFDVYVYFQGRETGRGHRLVVSEREPKIRWFLHNSSVMRGRVLRGDVVFRRHLGSELVEEG